MATLSLGSGLVNKITSKVFSDTSFQSGGSLYSGSYGASISATNIGMGGTGYSAWNNYNPTQVPLPSFFSLMKGTVPSSISDISNNQRSADELVRFTGPRPNSSSITNTNSTYQITISSDSSIPYNSTPSTANDFLITVTGDQATWSALNLSFLPRYPVASGTPTWFWFRTQGWEHNIFGTVGATGSGSDLELATYDYIDATKEYTLYNATMAVFQMTQDINY